MANDSQNSASEEENKQEENKQEEKKQEEKKPESKKSNKKGEDEDYNPYSDPAVGSSALAEVIATELKGAGNSPTLEACREAYKQGKKD